MDIRGGSTTVPSAGYADLAPGIGFEPNDEPLRRDINLLGRVLGRILIEQEGEDLFETEEEVRLLCKRLRFDYAPELDEKPRRRSIRLRNPCVNPLSFVQVALLRRLRALGEDSPEREDVLNVLLLSISGVSLGMLNTG
jgi:phosphoenolpyruvate carboxylase